MMNPIIETEIWDDESQEEINRIMKKAGYILLIEGNLTYVWALKKFVFSEENE